MRQPFLFLAAFVSCAMAVAVPPVSAAQTCTSVADQSAYEVLALREMMILLATSKCGRDKAYEMSFIRRFQPELQANEREVTAYFRRLYGGRGQGMKDSFQTELVNVMSQQANIQAGEFCSRAGWIITEMDALPSTSDLAPYAAVKDLSPVGMSMCPVTAARAPAPAPKRR
jgi:hypothetical protein